MNNQMILDFLLKIRQNIDVLIQTVQQPNNSSEDAIKTIRDTRIDMTHLYNLFKAEGQLLGLKNSLI
jgi:hypothetical protein